MILLALICIVKGSNYEIPGYYGSFYKDFDANSSSSRSFYWSFGHHVDEVGNFWNADQNSHTLNSVEFTETKTAKFFRVSGTPNYPGYRDGSALNALFNSPKSLFFYKEHTNQSTFQNKIYVSDSGNHCIREVHLDKQEVWRYAGECTQKGFKDGPLQTARFNFPSLIGLDAQGYMYVLDEGNKYVRLIDMQNKQVMTLLNGACRRAQEIDSTYAPLPYYNVSESQLGTLMIQMVCVSGMVKTSGEPSEHIYKETQVENCLDHDILCGERSHPLVASD